MTKVRLAGSVLAAVCTLTACGSGAPASPAGPAVSMAPPPSAGMSGTPDGVTTDADVFGPACPRLPRGPRPVAAVASANPMLTRLVAAMTAAGLVDALDNRPAMTVFAPADPAFAALGAAGPGDLVRIIEHHVIGTRYDAKGLATAGSVAPLDAAAGPLKIEGAGENMTVDGAKILCGNIPAKNATVFVIDKVLIPGRP